MYSDMGSPSSRSLFSTVLKSGRRGVLRSRHTSSRSKLQAAMELLLYVRPNTEQMRAAGCGVVVLRKPLSPIGGEEIVIPLKCSQQLHTLSLKPSSAIQRELGKGRNDRARVERAVLLKIPVTFFFVGDKDTFIIFGRFVPLLSAIQRGLARDHEAAGLL